MSLSHRILGSLLLPLIFIPSQNALSEALGTKWPKASAIFLTGGLPVGGPASSLPGNTETWRVAATEAANRWNSKQSAFKLTTLSTLGNGVCQSFGDNNLVFSLTACGGIPFEDKVLAITASWSNDTTIIKADIIFNVDRDWGIYNDTLLYSTQDFRRVATHEFGHAMGLKHTTNNNALMFPTASDIFSPTPDDVESLESIYKEEKDSGGSITYLFLLALGIWPLRLISTHKKAD